MSGTEDPLSTVLDEVATAVPRLLTRTRRQLLVGRNAVTLVVCRRLPPAPRTVASATRERVPLTVVDVVAEDWTAANATAPDDAASPVTGIARPVRPSVPSAPVEPPESAPAASELALEDYDALAASQVVPRLASLSVAELELVGRYERTHRNRQTILNRVEQLLSGSS